MRYYLLNPLSNNGIKPINFDKDFIDITKIDAEDFFSKLNKEDEVVIIGGDGTLNHLANDIYDLKVTNNIYLYPNGSGNDLIKDINGKLNEENLINNYLINLPLAKVNGRELRFINDMGFGLDGFCCEEADKLRKISPQKKINYVAIALRGLLRDYKSKHATITVDDKTYEFDNVWLAPTMKGRYYGGGVKIAPNQDRNSDLLTLVIYHTKSKFKSMVFFPTIFTGDHIKKKDMISVFTGKKIHVKFSSPCAAQIDGETILNVEEYFAEL